MSHQGVPEDGLKALVIAMEAKVQSADQFTLLGVAPGADAATVKAAFFQLAKRLHPDKYFRKDLGELRPRLEAVFKALSKAHQTLTHPEKREAYLAAHPELKPAPPRAPMKRMQWQKSELAAAIDALKGRK